uniref:Uncharacterized protein n=1 Tax=Arundo donax TaxID=35708 RepID=A0A0A9ANV0_ARUDO
MCSRRRPRKDLKLQFVNVEMTVKMKVCTLILLR